MCWCHGCPVFKVLFRNLFGSLFFIILLCFEFWIGYVTSVTFALLLLTCLLSCARYFEKAFNCDLIASCSTLFVGYEFASYATFLVFWLLRVPLYLWDTNPLLTRFISSLILWDVYLHCCVFCLACIFMQVDCVVVSDTHHLWFIFTPMLWGLCWMSDFWLALFVDASLLEVFRVS